MKISELIEALEAELEEEGDLTVEIYDIYKEDFGPVGNLNFHFAYGVLRLMGE